MMASSRSTEIMGAIGVHDIMWKAYVLSCKIERDMRYDPNRRWVAAVIHVSFDW